MEIDSNNSEIMTTTTLSTTSNNCSANLSNHSTNIYEMYSAKRRILISITLALVALQLPFSNSLYLPSLANIERDLKTSSWLVNYTIAGYLIAAGISSIFWGPLSDRFGRRIIIVIALISYLGFTLLCTLARNIILLLILRSLQGVSISAPTVVGQSAIVDIFSPDKLGLGMSIFLVPYLMGIIPGSFIGGALSNSFGWRSTFITQAIMGVISILIVFLLVPETHHYYVAQKLLCDTKTCQLTDQTRQTIEHKSDTILKPKFIPPWYPFSFLADYSILPFMATCTMNFSSLFILLTLMSLRETQEPYFLSSLRIGFSYFPPNIGTLVGSFTGGLVSDWSAKRFSQATEGRLVLNLIGSLSCSFGFLLYGWTFHMGAPLVLPLIGSVMAAFGDSFLFTSTCAFINIKRSDVAGSIFALINVLNLSCAGIGIIIAAPMLALMRFGPLFSVLSGASFIMIGVSLIIVVQQLRRSSPQITCPHGSSVNPAFNNDELRSIETDST